MFRRKLRSCSEIFASEPMARWPGVAKHTRRNKLRWTSTCEVSRSLSSATGGTQVTNSRESVVLRAGKGPDALPLLRVVISGLASRQNLLMEQVDDVQLAVETLVAEEPGTTGEFVLQVWPEDGGLVLLLDGLTSERVRTALTATGPRGALKTFCSMSACSWNRLWISSPSWRMPRAVSP